MPDRYAYLDAAYRFAIHKNKTAIQHVCIPVLCISETSYFLWPVIADEAREIREKGKVCLFYLVRMSQQSGGFYEGSHPLV